MAYAEITEIAEPYLDGKVSVSTSEFEDCKVLIGADRKLWLVKGDD